MNILDYLGPIAVGVVFVILLLGLWNMMRGGAANTSQRLMRMRVVAQFLAIILILLAVYFAGR
jgi:hypothetical protein